MNKENHLEVTKGKSFLKSWKTKLENRVHKGSNIMNNVYDEIKSKVSLQDLAENLLGKGKSGNGYISYKCPFHNEQKGRSLVVYSHHWECYGACGCKGDQFSLVEKKFNVNHAGARQWLIDNYLNGNPSSNTNYTPSTPKEKPQQPISEPPPSDWQQKATAIKHRAMDNLHSTAGKRALDYLMKQRGLGIGVILNAELGYIPGHFTDWIKLEGLNIPCGITIPWVASGAIWGIKVRRSAGDRRYEQIAGGNIKGCLYRADEITPGLPIVFSEGEFDSLIVWQTTFPILNSTCLGSSSNTKINRRWYPQLATAPCLLSAMDNDEAGEKANKELMQLSSAFYRIVYPNGMDANDFFLSQTDEQDRTDLTPVATNVLFSQWIENQINQLTKTA